MLFSVVEQPDDDNTEKLYLFEYSLFMLTCLIFLCKLTDTIHRLNLWLLQCKCIEMVNEVVNRLLIKPIFPLLSSPLVV